MSKNSVKHQPVTLPEKVCDSRGLLFGETSGRTLTYEQYAEVARRANSYPKLMEALRTLMARMDGCELGPVNGGREIADQIAEEAQASRALLRALGES